MQPLSAIDSTLRYTILQTAPKPVPLGFALLAYAGFLAWTEQPIGVLHLAVLAALALLFVVRLRAVGQTPRRGSLSVAHDQVAWTDSRSGDWVTVPYENLNHVVVGLEDGQLRLTLVGDDEDEWPRHLTLTAAQIEVDPPISLHELRFEIEMRRRYVVAKTIADPDQEDTSKAKIAKRSWYRYCPATLAVTFLLTVITVLEMVTFAFFNPITLLRMGALSPALVAAGEWWRLATGSLLHGNLLHLLLNGLGLLFLGYVVERALGSARFLVIYLSACVGCSLASAWQTDALLAVGASGGLFGLVGAYSVLHWRWSSNRRREAKRQALALAITFVSPALFISNADHWGHAGGLLVGLVLTGFVYRQDRRDMTTSPNLWTRLAAAGWVLFFSAAITQAAHSYTVLGSAPSMAVLLNHTDDLPEILINEIAWPVAIDPHAERADLELAKERMQWALDSPDDHASKDTLATLHYRLQEFDAAVELQSSLPWQENPVFAAQLMRFLWARQQDAQAGVGASTNSAAPTCCESVPWTLSLRELEADALVLLVFTRQQKAEVMAAVTLPAGRVDRLEIPLPKDFDISSSSLSMIERMPADESSPRGAWRFYDMVEEIVDLP